MLGVSWGEFTIKFIIVPLFLMFIVALSGMMGLGNGGTFDGSHSFYWEVAAHYEDVAGHWVLDENRTALGESGTFISGGFNYLFPDMASNTPKWKNSTGTYNLEFVEEDTQTAIAADIDITGAYGFLAILAVMIALCAVVGLRVLGSGVSEFSVEAIIKGGFFITIWGILSGLSLAPITGIPIFGALLYIGLSFFFVIGAVNALGHPSSED